MDDLARLTHKARHPHLYRATFTTEKGETTVPKPFANPKVAFKDPSNPHFTFIDLFAGIGGFRLAGQKVKGSCVFTSEWDKYARRAYFMNFGQVPYGDITKFTENEETLNTIPKHDVLCGGFPCQAFSISGKQEGFRDPRGTLFFEIYKIAKQHKPKVLFLENVKNFARHDNGNTFKTIRYHLEKKMAEETNGKVSYRVSHAVLNASDFGASTKRERIYIVAVRSDLADDDFIKWSEWLDLLQNLPNSRKYPKKYLREDIQPKKEIDPGLLDKLTLVRLDFRPKLTEHRDDIKTKDDETEEAAKPIRIGVMGKGGQGERIYSTNGHAITFSAYGGGAASKTGAYYVDGIVRKLTPTECARAMGFNGMNVSTGDVPLLQRYKQFGNSVVVNVVEAIFSEIVNFWLKKKADQKKEGLFPDEKSEEPQAQEDENQKPNSRVKDHKSSAQATGDQSNDKRGDNAAYLLGKIICSNGEEARRFSLLISRARASRIPFKPHSWHLAKGGSKSNLIITTETGEEPVAVSVFSASKANFNHLERKWPDKYSAELGWSRDFSILLNLFTGKIQPSKQHEEFLGTGYSKTRGRIAWDDFNKKGRTLLLDGLNRTKETLLHNAFCGTGKAAECQDGLKFRDSVEIIAFYDARSSENESPWSFCISRNVVEGVIAGVVKPKPSGTVIAIGDVVTLQRYGGGAGSGDVSQKAQLQIKVKPRNLFEESVNWTKYDEIAEDLNLNYVEETDTSEYGFKSQAAKRGLSAEMALINSINAQDPDSKWIVEEITGQENYGVFKARKPSNKEKPDVIIYSDAAKDFKGSGISVKTYDENASFNQANRTSPDKFSQELGFPPDVAQTLRNFTIKNADGSRIMLNQATDAAQHELLSFFTKFQRQIISHILRGKQHAELNADWMIFHEANDEKWIQRIGNPKFWGLHPMSEVINCCCSVSPSITKAGNLAIGLGLTLQRKGGDGGAKSANDLQAKLNPKAIREALKNQLT